MEDSTSLAESAAQKMATGSLMTIDEVAAKLDVAPMTVHRLSLKSIRIGRLLRFDPKDVDRLIEQSKEAVIAPGEQPSAEELGIQQTQKDGQGN